MLTLRIRESLSAGLLENLASKLSLLFTVCSRESSMISLRLMKKESPALKRLSYENQMYPSFVECVGSGTNLKIVSFSSSSDVEESAAG